MDLQTVLRSGLHLGPRTVVIICVFLHSIFTPAVVRGDPDVF